MRPPKARRIVIAVYEGVSLLDLAGPLEAFRVASGFGGSRESRVTYECSVVSIPGGPLKTADGVELVTESVRSLGRDPIDTLIEARFRISCSAIVSGPSRSPADRPP